MLNTIKNKIFSKQDRTVKIFFAFLALLLIIKYFLITNTGDFLNTYKFMSSDSYDWIANGLQLFLNNSITFRNPGLPLIIKLLNGLNLLFLLPLINQFIFFLILLFIYKICRLFSTRFISLLLVALLFFNYGFNLGANDILADYYAIGFITISLYYLLVKKYKLAFLWLGVSVLFQNFAYFLLPIWLVAYLYKNREYLRSFRTIKNKINTVILLFVPLIIFFLAVLPWHLYKFLVTGNFLYSKVEQFGLLVPNLDSIFFYGLVAVSLFSFLILVLIVYIIWNLKKVFQNKLLLFFIAGLTVNFIFWVIFYNWNDRRFMLYFIPWIIPIFAWFFNEIKVHLNYKLIFILIAFYPTFLPLSNSLVKRELPVVHNYYLEIDYFSQENKIETYIKSRPEFVNLIMDINPIFYNYFKNSEEFKYDTSRYTYYAEYVDLNYSKENNSICIDKNKDLYMYVIRSIVLIKNNVDIDKLHLIKSENCKTPSSNLV